MSSRLILTFDADDIEHLRTLSYSVLVSKDISGKNLLSTWVQIRPDLITRTVTISWTEEYQAFATTQLSSAGSLIDFATQDPVSLGNRYTYDGIFKFEKGGVPFEVFVRNNYPAPRTCIGLCQKQATISGEIYKPLGSLEIGSQTNNVLKPLPKVWVYVGNGVQDYAIEISSVGDQLQLDYSNSTERRARFDRQRNRFVQT